MLPRKLPQALVATEVAVTPKYCDFSFLALPGNCAKMRPIDK
jgi:hypothetical protein